MTLAPFSKATKRAARERSGEKCEAVGTWYGLEEGQRCNAPLSKGVEFDHIDLDANSRDNSLDNAAAVCIPCHRFKTKHRDIPLAAKTLRQQDKDKGIERASQMPCSRSTPWKRTMSGRTVCRSCGEEPRACGCKRITQEA